jgi:Holliday junction resolvasome RuvABC endonuclease subunit
MSYVWGIDPALARVAFAFAPDDGGLVTCELLSVPVIEADLTLRIRALSRAVAARAPLYAAARPPACIWLEQPSGRHRNPHLLYGVGALLVALSEATRAPVWLIGPTAWKKRVLAHGHASKADVAAYVAEQGVVARTQDEADAAAIAMAGRSLYATRVREVTA